MASWINLLVIPHLCNPALVVVNEIIRFLAVISKVPLVTAVVKKWHIQRMCSKNPPSHKTQGTDQTAQSESDVDFEPLAVDKVDGWSLYSITEVHWWWELIFKMLHWVVMHLKKSGTFLKPLYTKVFLPFSTKQRSAEIFDSPLDAKTERCLIKWYY